MSFPTLLNSFLQVDFYSSFMTFCLKHPSIPSPVFQLVHNPMLRTTTTTSWISRTTHLSKSDLYLSWSSSNYYKSCLMKTTAFRKSGCEKKMKVFEQEGLVDEDIELSIVNGGFEASLNRLSKWIVSLTFGAIVILRHDPEAMWLLSGSILNTILAAVLKRVLNQDRPVSNLKKSDPGMPSSHAQSIFFVSAYITVSMLGTFGVNALTLLLSSVVLALASYLSWLRVTQQYHTVSQVLVGGILGSVFSVLWLWSWNAVIHEAYVSYLLVRVCVVLGAVGFSVAFALYVIRYWFKDIYR